MPVYNIRPEYEKYKNFMVPLNPVLLRVINVAMPIVHKSNSPYRKKLITEKIDFKDFTSELIYPKGMKELPCMVYFHGGGFVLKASRMHRNIVREYAYRAGIAVLFVDYRLAPKYSFPTPFNDCYQAYCWAVDNFQNQRIYVGGDSAGGNFALGICRQAIRDGKKKPDKLLLVYPVVDPRMHTDSMKLYDDSPIWNSKLNHKMWKYYLNGAKADDPRFTFKGEDDYSEFPDSYIETAEYDCLQDEGIMLAKAMRRSKVSVREVNTTGTIHAFDVEEQAQYVRSIVEGRINFLKA